MGVQKTPIQKTCKIALDFDLININFLALIDNLIGYKYQISLVFDNSDKHTPFMILQC